jgi:hypothetical protein
MKIIILSIMSIVVLGIQQIAFAQFDDKAARLQYK